MNSPFHSRIFMRLVLALSLLGGLCLAALGWAAAPPSSVGKDFWLTFPANTTQPPNLTLYLSSSTLASATVSMLGPGPGLPFVSTVSISAGGVTAVNLPSSADLGMRSDVVTTFGIHVTSNQAISVYGFNQAPFTSDSYLGLPTPALGNTYYVMAYGNTDSSIPATEFALVAASSGTTHVTVIPSVSTYSAASNVTHPAGVAYVVTLTAQGQTYQLFNNNPVNSPATDLTGTLLQADQPIAVFGANQCAQVPASGLFSNPNAACCCDHVVEEMPPVQAWGRQFFTMPLAGKTADRFRILAAQDGTVVSINGAAAATLNHGQFYEISLSQASMISSCSPILVAQYATSLNYNNDNLGDPMEMLIPPYEQYLNQYTFYSIPSGTGFSALNSSEPGFGSNTYPYKDYVNIVAPSSSLGGIVLDGAPLVATFTPIGSSGFSGAQVPVAGGPHTISGALPLGIFLYGWIQAFNSTENQLHTEDEYGNPGGAAFSPAGNVSSLSLTPKMQTVLVNGNACVSANLSDALSNPVAGVRVDFSVNGQAKGFSYSDSSGNALYCYSNSLPTLDTVVASMACVSDTAQVRWVVPTPTPTVTATPTFTITPTFSNSPTYTMTPTYTSSFTNSPTSTITPTFSDSPTASPTPSITQTFSNSPTNSPSPTISPTPTLEPAIRLNAAIYNTAGELVLRLVDGVMVYRVPNSLRAPVASFDPDSQGQAVLSADGSGQTFSWNGKGANGQVVASGAYLVVLTAIDSFDHVTTYNTQVQVVRSFSLTSLAIYNSAGEVVRHVDLSGGLAAASQALGASGGSSAWQTQLTLAGVQVAWNGRNDAGILVNSGVYIARAYRNNVLASTQNVLVLHGDGVSPLASAFAAPNPARRRGAVRVWLAPNMPLAGANVQGSVFDLAGEKVADCQLDQANGQLIWALDESVGEGVYGMHLLELDGAGEKQEKWIKIGVTK